MYILDFLKRNGVLNECRVTSVLCILHEAEFAHVADVTTGGAERAIMDIIIPLYSDSGKLKDWLTSTCSTVTVAGDSLAMFWDMFDLESSDMPTSTAVCQAAAEEIRTLVTYGLGIFSTVVKIDWA